ncbi:MAG: alanine racemase [Tenacibaculum sp.]
MPNATYNNYFERLNKVLKNHHRALPCLIVDLDIVDKNTEVFKYNLKPSANFRIVVKSLPSQNLIQYIMDKIGTSDLMVFHQPFLSDLTRSLNNKSDILLGKPMPVKTVKYYYSNLHDRKHNFNPYTQIQWLVDTQDRILQYIKLAKELGKKLRLNFEIDIGLHRGGFQTLNELRRALELIKKHTKHVEFSGFMGYDPHIVKIPKILRSQGKGLRMSNKFYGNCKRLIEEKFPQFWNKNLTFNGSGSSTLSLHNTVSSPLNDIAAGSCFVKPITFDIATLSKYKPACFIATPVLKKLKGTVIPGIERLKSILHFINPRNAQSFFIYGGYWKADYVSPKGASQNSLFGASTNQTMVNMPNTVNLNVDDFVFLRPQQSEFVFLQFGKLLIVRGDKIIDQWGLLKNH